PNNKELAQIAGSHIEAVTRTCERCDLICAGFEQISVRSKMTIARNGINVSAITCPHQQRVAAQCKGVDDVIARIPDTFRSSLWSDSVDFSAAGHRSRRRDVCDLRCGSAAGCWRRILRQSQW